MEPWGCLPLLPRPPAGRRTAAPGSRWRARRVDLLYRDLDAARRRRDDGETGRYAVDRAEGYLGGIASYVLAGELPGEGWRASRPGRSFATRCAGSRRHAGG